MDRVLLSSHLPFNKRISASLKIISENVPTSKRSCSLLDLRTGGRDSFAWSSVGWRDERINGSAKHTNLRSFTRFYLIQCVEAASTFARSNATAVNVTFSGTVIDRDVIQVRRSLEILSQYLCTVKEIPSRSNLRNFRPSARTTIVNVGPNTKFDRPVQVTTNATWCCIYS